MNLKKLPSISEQARKPRPYYLLLCMILPALIMYLIYLAKGIHPFGDGCVLVLDLNGQYVWFFEALRNFVKGDADLLYTFARSLGGEFLGTYAYYVASPLSYLLCLFPQNRMLEGLLFLFLLKTAICGGTFGYYMHKTMKQVKPFSIVAFSIFYALSAYAVVQQHNTMWIDALMWLPLITLGMEHLIKHGKYKLYTIFLALTLISNYYIGYMVCIYCLLYFFLYYVAHGGSEKQNNPHGESMHFLKSLLRIAIYSLIAIGIAATILLAAYYSLNFGKTTFSNPKWEVTLKFDILEMLYKFLPGSYDTVRPAGLPFLYCGVLTLLLLPSYFLSRKFSMRQKIVSGVFIFIFIASFSLSFVDLIWHGFQKPNWLNYRYSFMLCFYLCVLACRAFADFESVSMRSVAVTGGLIGVLCVILQKYEGSEYIEPNDFSCIWFTIIAVFVYLAVLGTLKIAKDRQLVSTVLVCVVVMETFLCGLWNLNGLDKDVNYTNYSYYNNFLNKTRPIVETVQEMDDSFYRMEKTFFRKYNDNMALGIRGLSGSTSALNKETIQFLNKMGYHADSHRSKYLGGNPVSDSLLGLKYIISDNSVYGNYYDVFATDAENGYTAYYNPYHLSLAYGVSEELLEFPLGYVPVEPEDDEKDENEETEEKGIAAFMSNLISSVKSTVNGILGIDETVNSAEYLDEYHSPFERLNAIVTSMLGEEETVHIFVPVSDVTKSTSNLDMAAASGHTRYAPDDTARDGILTYQLEMPENAELFFYAPATAKREVDLQISVDGASSKKLGSFNGSETTRIISLGWQNAGSEIELDLILQEKYFYVLNKQDCFYYIDWDVFEDAMARLAEDQFIIEDYTEHSFEGSFTAGEEKELVLTSLPYDKGWKVYVDGKPVETQKALGSLVSFFVEGEVGETHTLELVYSPPIVWIGIGISTFFLALLILIIVFESKIKGWKILRTLVGVPRSESSEQTMELLTEEKPQIPSDLLEENPTAPSETDQASEPESETKGSE